MFLGKFPLLFLFGFLIISGVFLFFRERLGKNIILTVLCDRIVLQAFLFSAIIFSAADINLQNCIYLSVSVAVFSFFQFLCLKNQDEFLY